MQQTRRTHTRGEGVFRDSVRRGHALPPHQMLTRAGFDGTTVTTSLTAAGLLATSTH